MALPLVGAAGLVVGAAGRALVGGALRSAGFAIGTAGRVAVGGGVRGLVARGAVAGVVRTIGRSGAPDVPVRRPCSLEQASADLRASLAALNQPNPYFSLGPRRLARRTGPYSAL